MTNNAVLANLAVDVYSPHRGQDDAVIVRNGYAGFTIPNGIDVGDDKASGLQAQAYVNEDTKEIVLAYAGTNGVKGDVPVDIDIVTGGYHQQFHDALDWTRSIIGDNEIQFIPDANFAGDTQRLAA